MRTTAALVLSVVALALPHPALLGQGAPAPGPRGGPRWLAAGRESGLLALRPLPADSADSTNPGRGDVSLRNPISAAIFAVVGAGVGLIFEDGAHERNPTGAENSKAMELGAVGGLVVWLLLSRTNWLYLPVPLPRGGPQVGAVISPAGLGVRITP